MSVWSSLQYNNFGFLAFSGGIEREHWPEMGHSQRWELNFTMQTLTDWFLYDGNIGL